MIIPSVCLSEDVHTVTNKYLVTDVIEGSPDLLTDPLDENDSKSSLTTHSHFQLHKIGKCTKEVGQRCGGKDGDGAETGGER
jgi:hypothetical protein